MKNDKFIPSVRYLPNGIRLYFKTKNVIQISQNGHHYNLVRFGSDGYRKSWLPLCEALWRRNKLENIFEITKLAAHYGIRTTYARYPEEPPTDIWVRPSVYAKSCRKEKNGDAQTYEN